MDLKSEPQMFRKYPNMCNISPEMINVMDNQPVKNRQDLKQQKQVTLYRNPIRNKLVNSGFVQSQEYSEDEKMVWMIS